MVDDGIGPDDVATPDAALAVAARHALHDEEIVAALATGSLEDAAEVARAQALVDRCTACRDLHRDIAAIGDALRMDAKGTTAAPRDFRLSAEDARRLGGPVSVGGFLAAFRRSMVSFARPVGASMAALGLVGLLIGSVALGGGAASAPITAGTGPADESAAPAEIQTGAEQTGGPKSSDRSDASGPESSAYATEIDNPAPRDDAAVDPNPVVWLLGGSAALLVAGIGLLAVAFRRGRGNEVRTRDS